MIHIIYLIHLIHMICIIYVYIKYVIYIYIYNISNEYDRDGRVKSNKNQKTTKNRKTKSIERNKSQHEGSKKDASNKIRQASTCKEKTAKKMTSDVVIVTKHFSSRSFVQRRRRRKSRCDGRHRFLIFYETAFGLQRLRSHAASPVRCNSTVTRNVDNYFRLIKCRTC